MSFLLDQGGESILRSLSGNYIDLRSIAGQPAHMNFSSAGASIDGTITFTGNISSAGQTITGSVLSNSPVGGVGYATGAGGTVTQATSKSTGVTLNTITGQITMNAAALAAATSVDFVLSDTSIAATDVVIVNIKSGPATAGTYQVGVDAIAVGSCTIQLRNISAGSLSEAVVLQFAVIKGANS